MKKNDPRLKQKCEPHVITDKTQELVYDMIITMQEYDGIGLAASQVGVMERVFVIGHKDTGFVVCINPSWEATQDAEEEKLQRRLFEFSIKMSVRRYNKVLCTFTNLKGETQTKLFTGVWAQAIQHENDHLEGITFDERVSESTLSRAKALRREKNKKNKEATERKNELFRIHIIKCRG